MKSMMPNRNPGLSVCLNVTSYDLTDTNIFRIFVLANQISKDMENEMKFCQSCGMPLTDELLGTNADGSKNEDYCIYCYKDGKFTMDCTMDQMIEHCAQFVDEVNKNLPKPITKEEYIAQMKMYFPQLKRWR